MLLKKIKNLPSLKLAALLLAASFAIIAGACLDDNIIISGKMPGIQMPGEQIPGGQVPGTQTPGTQVPGEQTPGTQVPGEQENTGENQGEGENSDGGEAVNYITSLSWGISTQASVATLGLTPGNDTTEVYLNWYSSGAASGKSAKVRFVRGTFTAGTKLLPEATGTASAASSGYTFHKVKVTGLEPGFNYQYAVSSDGNNWSAMYNFKVPSAAGAFKFAVITDPQLNVSSWDALNRHTPTGGAKTEFGWKETMEKVVAANVSFIASCGDQIDGLSGNEEEYNRFFAPDGLRSLPFAPVSGNHDNNLNYNYHFNWQGQTPPTSTTPTTTGRNYYYRYNNILFVVLDTGPSQTSATAAKTYIDNNFKTTFQTAKTAHAGKYDWLIVQHHKSTASVASHCADLELQYYVEGGFETLMSDQGVDFVLAGHDHVYARSYPLQGKDNGLVSVPDKSNGDSRTYANPGKPIYLTFNTASGLKYYLVSADKTINFNGTVASNAKYPYLGTDSGGTATLYGSVNYNAGNLPVSNVVFSQALIPSYTIVEVDGRAIKFSTYPIATKSGGSGVSAYNYDANTPYDWVQVTK